MNLYKELKEINRSLKKDTIDQADFRALLPRLLEKYKYCDTCHLAETMTFWGKQPPDRNIWGKLRKKFERHQ